MPHNDFVIGSYAPSYTGSMAMTLERWGSAGRSVMIVPPDLAFEEQVEGIGDLHVREASSWPRGREPAMGRDRLIEHRLRDAQALALEDHPLPADPQESCEAPRRSGRGPDARGDAERHQLIEIWQ